MRRARGFTMVEIVIVILIIGILAAMAWPSYQQHLRKGRRAQAQAFMGEVANKQQQYLLDARTYALGAGAFTTLNVAAPSDLAPFYTFNVTPAAATTPPSFTVTATAIGNQGCDGDLAIDDTGLKTRNVTSGACNESVGLKNW